MQKYDWSGHDYYDASEVDEEIADLQKQIEVLEENDVDLQEQIRKLTNALEKIQDIARFGIQ